MNRLLILILIITLPLHTACSQVESPVPIEEDNSAPISEHTSKPNAQAEVKTFDECVAAGNAILRSLPPKCISASGEVFTEGKTNQRNVAEPNEQPAQKGDSLCKDKCGNGTCEQIVCLGSTCPCAETPASCPEDCAAIDESHWN